MRRSVRQALEKVAAEEAKKATDAVMVRVVRHCVDVVRNEIAIAKACGQEEAVRHLRMVEAAIERIRE